AFELSAHELAHQWFGDTVTCRNWSHTWLNEGFATFLPLFARRTLQGADAYHVDRMRILESAAQVGRQKGDRPVVWTGFTTPLEMFDGYAYAGGAARLGMLMRQVGEGPFWKGVQTYLTTYRFRNADTTDFFQVMSKSTGKDLKGFMRQWFYTNGTPNVEIRRASDGWSVTQTISGFNLEVEANLVDQEGAVRKVNLSLILGA
ncbi:MAG: hypothetical protein C4320_07230, partial [Armatimonadota bacterium]